MFIFVFEKKRRNLNPKNQWLATYRLHHLSINWLHYLSEPFYFWLRRLLSTKCNFVRKCIKSFRISLLIKNRWLPHRFIVLLKKWFWSLHRRQKCCFWFKEKRWLKRSTRRFRRNNSSAFKSTVLNDFDLTRICFSNEIHSVPTSFARSIKNGQENSHDYQIFVVLPRMCFFFLYFYCLPLLIWCDI